MNADAITAKILEDARAQAARTLAEAQEKADRAHAQADSAIEEKRIESQAQADQQAAQLRDRMLRMAELDQKKAALQVKRDVIDQAFEGALSQMQSMPEAKKRDFLRQLILQAAQGGEALIPSEEERALYTPAFLEQINGDLQKAGRAGISLSDASRKLGGGFVLVKGGLEINCAFRTVLALERTALEAEVAKLLFE